VANLSSTALRIVLVLVGAMFVYIGINVGFGGIRTLGFQGPTSFLEVTNMAAYLIQDSHVRFLGGVFGAMGLFLILGATNLPKFQTGLKLVFALTFIGGLTRFSMPGVIFGSGVLGSLLGELVLMPILYFWLTRVVKSSHPTTDN
jgi:hypothetical protein